MYQINFSMSKDNSSWFEHISPSLTIRLNNESAIIASSEHRLRQNVSVACENEHKAAVNNILQESFVDLFSTFVKYEYLKSKLHLPLLRESSREILLHTFVAFDRLVEREIIENKLAVSNNMALDGVYNFLLQELRARWLSIVNLAMESSCFAINENSLNDLLRFLMSAINPKILALDITQQNGEYMVKGDFCNSKFQYRMTSQQLMIYLVDIAPLQLNLRGDFTNKDLYNRLVDIFDAKTSSI